MTKIKTVQSASGVEAWLVEDYAVPIISVDFQFRGGASRDPAGKSGAAHLMASLLDEGAGDLDDVAFQEKIEENAVELSFGASRDSVSGSLRTLAEKKDVAFALLREALNRPRFDDAPTDRVRESWLAALRRETKNPNAMASRALFKALFPAHPYANDHRGTVESLPGVGGEDARERHRALIARGNLVVSVVGAISADETRRMLDDVFGALPERAVLPDVATVQPAAIGERVLIDLDTPQTVMQFATRGLARDDADYMPGLVLNHIFGGGSFTSRLFQEVREKRGLTYSVYSQLVNFNHAAMVAGGCATKNERAAESLEVISHELNDLTAKGATDEELVKAKRFLTGSYALRFDTSGKIAGQLTQIQLDRLGLDYIDRRNGLIEAVTSADLKRAAGRMFGDGRLLVVAVGRPVGLAA